MNVYATIALLASAILSSISTLFAARVVAKRHERADIDATSVELLPVESLIEEWNAAVSNITSSSAKINNAIADGCTPNEELFRNSITSLKKANRAALNILTACART